MRTLLMLGLLASAAIGAPQPGGAQSPPHEMKLDTPPVPGQIEETRRDKTRPGPSMSPVYEKQLGLPTSGPKSVDPRLFDPVRNEVVQRRLNPNPLF